jgi:lipopolysaccharide transport system permease protein
MVIFTVIFGHFVKIPADGLPYPIFAYAALIPWTYFARTVERSGNSIVGNSGLIKKVYFPRLVIPISAALAGLLDFSISFVVLFGMMGWYGFLPTWGALLIPLFLLLILLTALSVSLWLTALNARYRDVSYVIPFLTQLWMYASPVVYPVSIVPEQWRFIYCLNPMVGIIEGFRWALLGSRSPDFILMGISTTVVLMFLLAGIIYFKRMERTFADIL